MDIIFDIDGTLADCSRRLHYIQGPKKDWDKLEPETRALLGEKE